MGKKGKFHLNAVIIAGIVMVGVGVALCVMLNVLKMPQVQEWYKQYEDVLTDIENRIVNLDNKTWIFLIIMFLFSLKAVLPFPVYPVSFLCVTTSVVFNVYVSLAINALGLSLLFTVKYFWGKRLGSGFAGRILPRYEKAWSIVEHNGNGNPWLLVGMRAIPVFPINAVSGLYGSLDFGYFRYLLLSLLGFVPKLAFYTIIGRNVFDPLSFAFILPIAVLIILSGISMIAINLIVDTINRKSIQG